MCAHEQEAARTVLLCFSLRFAPARDAIARAHAKAEFAHVFYTQTAQVRTGPNAVRPKPATGGSDFRVRTGSE